MRKSPEATATRPAPHSTPGACRLNRWMRPASAPGTGTAPLTSCCRPPSLWAGSPSTNTTNAAIAPLLVNPLGQRVDITFDPTPNGTHNQPSRLTRYLLGVPLDFNGKTSSRQGIGRHRPWEN